MTKMANLRKMHAEISRWLDELRKSDAADDEVIRAIEDRISVETDETKLRLFKTALAREHSEQGNEAAVDALDRELLSEVDYWYQKLTRTNRTAFDKNIEAIEDRIRAKPGAPDVDELYTYLSHQYSAQGNYAAAEAIDRQLADRHPDDPLPLNRAAINKCSLQDQPGQAMELINRALEVTHRTGEFRRYTLGNKARIALALKRYDLVEGVLKEIMKLKVDPEVPDIGPRARFF